MSTSYDQFTKFSDAIRQFDQYLLDEGIKGPLILMLNEQSVITVMDVTFDSYSLDVQFPEPILEITFTGVKHKTAQGAIKDVGYMCVKLELKPHGRVLYEKVVVTRAHQIERLTRIDIHA